MPRGAVARKLHGNRFGLDTRQTIPSHPLRMKLWCPVLVFLAVAARALGGDFASDFAVVMVDDATERKLGAFPYDRAQYAKAIDACVRLEAKAVVLKFFFDQAKSPEGDAALATAMKKLPVAIQTRLEATEGTAQMLAPRFKFGDHRLPAAERGDLGWMPLPALLDAAAALGFVDFDGPTIPLVEEYRGASYRSLVLCCLELATGKPARAEAGGKIYVGDGWLPVDANNVWHGSLKAAEPVKTIAFADLLDGTVPAGSIAGRVIILGWDSAKTPTLPTERGEMRIHQV
ncbi:MAG: CHASE2 domain-containing protein, partial [Verrucomicrobiota bacterium]